MTPAEAWLKQAEDLVRAARYSFQHDEVMDFLAQSPPGLTDPEIVNLADRFGLPEDQLREHINYLLEKRSRPR